MIVGAALIELHVHGSQSLKAKRGVVKSLTARMRNKFNVAVAEVGVERAAPDGERLLVAGVARRAVTDGHLGAFFFGVTDGER